VDSAEVEACDWAESLLAFFLLLLVPPSTESCFIGLRRDLWRDFARLSVTLSVAPPRCPSQDPKEAGELERAVRACQTLSCSLALSRALSVRVCVWVGGWVGVLMRRTALCPYQDLKAPAEAGAMPNWAARVAVLGLVCFRCRGNMRVVHLGRSTCHAISGRGD